MAEPEIADASSLIDKVEGNSTEDRARMMISRTVPYANSVFFHARTVVDSVGFMTKTVVIGVNERGVHYFSARPNVYLHSAELRDIKRFGFCEAAVFFETRVANSLHKFAFQTNKGEEICIALQRSINDEMDKRKEMAILNAQQAARNLLIEALENELEDLRGRVERQDKALVDSELETRRLKHEFDDKIESSNRTMLMLTDDYRNLASENTKLSSAINGLTGKLELLAVREKIVHDFGIEDNDKLENHDNRVQLCGIRQFIMSMCCRAMCLRVSLRKLIVRFEET